MKGPITSLRFLAGAFAVLAVGAVFTILSHPPPVASATFPSDLYLGDLQQYRVRPNESLIEIARRFDLGFNEISDANPGVDPFIPKAGSLIIIPTAWLLPEVARRPAVVVNIPELRLYYLPQGRGMIRTFPLGIGDEGKDTPAGSYTIIEKIRHPPWHVPKSIRAERRELPEVMPPGPNNPMGSHALRLSKKSILIHGTNRPWGIGRRSSHGCLRLYPEDITQLYRIVPKGMPVVIVNQPVKVAGRGEAVFVEAHKFQREELTVRQALDLLARKKLLARTDFGKLRQAIQERRGYPIDVTLRVSPR